MTVSEAVASMSVDRRHVDCRVFIKHVTRDTWLTLTLTLTCRISFRQHETRVIHWSDTDVADTVASSNLNIRGFNNGVWLGHVTHFLKLGRPFICGTGEDRHFKFDTLKPIVHMRR